MPLNGALAKVLKLQGVGYDLKQGGEHQIGLIAEDVGKVVPEVVEWEADGIDARGMDYARLTALLIEATKEQQTEIERLARANAEKQEQIASLMRQVRQLTSVEARLERLEKRPSAELKKANTAKKTKKGNPASAANRPAVIAQTRLSN